MLTSIHKQTGERIQSIDFSSGHELRAKFPGRSLACPSCGEDVHAVDRPGFVLYFRHNHFGNCTIAHHEETPEHEHGKFQIAKYFEQQIKDDPIKIATVKLEYPLPQCGDNGRIADVALVYDNGNILIGECQLAAITPHELETRTLDYHAIGADVIWFLGGKAYTDENCNWLQANFGAVGVVSFDYQTVHIQ